MTTIDLTEYLAHEAESFRRLRERRDAYQKRMRMVAGNVAETLRKNLKRGDRVRMRTSPGRKALDYTFDSVFVSEGKDNRAYIVVSTETDCLRRVIPAISEDGEMFPGYSEIYVVEKNLKLK